MTRRLSERDYMLSISPDHGWSKARFDDRFFCKWVVYRAYSLNLLLYVGCTGRPWQRLRDHARDAHWYRRVDHLELMPYDYEVQAQMAERHAIETEWPLYNIAGRSV
jgi:hypothetical protein